MRRARIAAVIKKNTSVIPVNPEFSRDTRAQYKRLWVVAYYQVSILQEQQETSYEVQVNYYTGKINSNPEWAFAGIYADDGKSATTAHKRNDFQAMTDDCTAGKIDMVITKSISRFVRNTVDSFTHIQKLKVKSIVMHFEKENISTLGDGGEMLITILSSQAQEESRNLSKNVHWGYVRQFENGVVYVNHSKFLGYTKDEEGNPVVVPDEAKLVRRIFRLHPEGNSTNKVAETLTKEGIRTVAGSTMWHATVISKMLMNEKYMGDALLQKTCIVDSLEKKRAVNKGIVSQYYIEGNHEVITPRELFYQVQEEWARRANVYRPAKKKGTTVRRKHSSKYVLVDIMYCEECGQPHRRQVWVNDGAKKPVWCCCSRLRSGTKKCRHSPSLEEKALHEVIMEAIDSVVKDEGELIDAFRDNIIRAPGSYSDSVELIEYDEKVDVLQKQMLVLIKDSVRTESADEEFDRAYREITDQIRAFKKKGTELSREKQLAEAYDQRVEGMDQYIQKTNYLKRQFGDELVRRLIKTIMVTSEGKIEIQFYSGIVITQRINEYD